MKKIAAFLICCIAVFAGCHKDIKKDIKDLRKKLNALTEQVNGMNSSISALDEIVKASQGGVGVSSITERKEGGSVTGYTLVFSDGHILTIPVEGYGTPTIGVKQDGDGNWYWTWNGEWITYPDGSPVQSGKDGQTPLMDSHDGWWWISFDGSNWQKLTEVSDGSGGSAAFSSIRVEGTEIIFVQQDGSEIRVPRSPNIGISFSVPDSTYLNPGETIRIDYTLSGEISDGIRVTASSDGNYLVKITGTSKTQGYLTVSCPKSYADGYINVMVTDGVGYTLVKVINFFQREISLPGDDGITGAGASTLSYSVPCTGGNVTIPWSGNYGIVLNYRDGAASWINGAVNTRATINGDIVLTVSENTGNSVRTGLIDICPENNPSYTIKTIEIIQASAFFTIDRTRINVPSAGGSFTVNMTSSRGLDVRNAASWISQSTVQSGSSYTMTLAVAANGGDTRDGSLELWSSDGADKLAEILVHQLSSSYDSSLDLVIEVSANVANDYKVYLPLYGAVDCYIDWGDGSFDIVEKTISGTGWVSHTYAGLSVPTLFEVRVSGSVDKLCSLSGSTPMPCISTLRAVKQWGDLGLSLMDNAFRGAEQLYSIAADETGAFSAVTSMGAAFYGCSSLQEIPAGLLSHAGAVTSLSAGSIGTDYYGTFANCSSLALIPDGLFANCREVKNMSGLFSGCTSLLSVPAGMLDNCGKLTTVSGMFDACSELQNVPAGLFKNNGQVTSAAALFRSCSSLTSVPGNLFESFTLTRNFTSAFSGCRSLSVIPAGLFANCSSATNFTAVFNSCATLTEIPEDLFEAAVEAQDFTQAFYDCTSITGIPAGLFTANIKARIFYKTFSGCRALRGESPYSLINGSKVHLYERADWPDYFVKPTSYTDCFDYCTGLSDYSAIPSSWR